MKYFKNNNEIYAYDEEQILQGYGSDMMEITLEEVNAINKAKEDEYKQTVEYKISEAQAYLNNTDHKMYSDYERKEDETQEVMDYIKEQRSIARAFIRNNKE